MELFLGQLINGLTIGSTYALVALGIVVIFSVLDVVSIAQGQIFITAAYIGFVWFYHNVSQNLVLCSIVVVVASFVIGIVTEMVAVQPALHGGHRATLITTVGVGLILSNGVQILAGPPTRISRRLSSLRALVCPQTRESTAGHSYFYPIRLVS